MTCGLNWYFPAGGFYGEANLLPGTQDFVSRAFQKALGEQGVRLT